jgi:hypothetical protein
VHRPPLRIVPVLLTAACAWLAFSSAGLERLREHTDPPSFRYIPKAKLQSTIWKLADHAAQLDPPNYFLAGSVSGACVHCRAGE